jgi:hypothetical protein
MATWSAVADKEFSRASGPTEKPVTAGGEKSPPARGTDSDDWAITRVRELHASGEDTGAGVFVGRDGRRLSCFVMRSNGTVEKSPQGRTSLPPPKSVTEIDPQAEAMRIWDTLMGSLGAMLLEVMRQGWSVHVFPRESGEGWSGALRRTGFDSITAETQDDWPAACVTLLLEEWVRRR